MSQTQQIEATTGNTILAALPPDEHARLAPRLERISVEVSQVLFRPEECLTHVYFPETCVISLLTELSDGTGLEVGLVGYRGMAGTSAFLGGRETKLATVQGEGDALRMPADALRDEFRRAGRLQELLLAYTHALMQQISQSAVCNVRHRIGERFARWLLMHHDRLRRDEFYLTHEFMAQMLGVRRAGVSEAAAALQTEGLISYNRGHIIILDRAGLEGFACECYGVVREAVENETRLNGGRPAGRDFDS